MTSVYVFADCDGVRRHIDGLLLSAKLEEVREFSSRLDAALKKCGENAKSLLAADVIVAGGDDLLLMIPAEKYIFDLLEKVIRTLERDAGLPVSVGIGPTIEVAYINLARAKAKGAGRVGGGTR